MVDKKATITGPNITRRISGNPFNISKILLNAE
jgi:hypothetical protein